MPCMRCAICSCRLASSCWALPSCPAAAFCSACVPLSFCSAARAAAAELATACFSLAKASSAASFSSELGGSPAEHLSCWPIYSLRQCYAYMILHHQVCICLSGSLGINQRAECAMTHRGHDSPAWPPGELCWRSVACPVARPWQLHPAASAAALPRRRPQPRQFPSPAVRTS